MTIKKWERRLGGWQCRKLLMDVGPVSDLAGKIYMAGSVGEQCWWPGQDTVTVGTKILHTDSLADLVISKIDKLTGNIEDAINVPGRLYDAVTSMATDGLGNCIIAGYFNAYSRKDAAHQNDTLCFGSDCLIGASANTQMFLAKLRINPQDHTDDVSVDELNLPVATIAPNPSSGVFMIRGTNDVNWKVYNLNGKEITSGSNLEIDLTNQLPGMYIAVIHASSGVARIKIVRQN